jgi:hypothetical protein
MAASFGYEKGRHGFYILSLVNSEATLVTLINECGLKDIVEIETEACY